jgi:YidC/Oxa1 family membrane protein insertase
VNLNFLLPIWNPFIVHPIEAGLRALATPLEPVFSPGVAAALAIVLFTVLLRLLLLPLSLVQIRSQRKQMEIQPEVKALQKRFKGDREGLARAQMQLYKERGVNPAAGCLPLLIQLPILFGMYSAMSQLATQGLTLDQVIANQIQPGQVQYAAQRTEQPLPYNQFTLATLQVVPTSGDPITLQVPQDQADVSLKGESILRATEGLTLTPGRATGNTNPPNTPTGTASIFLRPGGVENSDGTFDRDVPVQVGQPYLIELVVNANGTQADAARAVVTFDPAALQVTGVTTPPLQDLAFKSPFLWLPSLGEPDLIHIPGLPGLPGLLLIIMTITSFLSQRMTTMPTEDPQQQAMMRSMAFMPLMYLIFFLGTPAGLVLYWLTSNVFSMFQQYFTIGLGLLGGDLLRLTGRDFQPPWAHLKTSPAGATRDLANGRVNGAVGDDEDEPDDADTTPAASQRVPPTTRRSRVGPANRRRRGKR